MDIDVKYSTLDIPLLFSFRIIREPVEVNAFAGAYISLPVSTGNISFDIEGYGTLNGSVDMEGINYGVVGGFDVGFGMGPGSLKVDSRFFYDFKPSKAKGELLGEGEQGMIYRRGLTVSVGYVFEI